MIILVINCGSSSIKYQLLDMQSDTQYTLKAKGIVEKISLPDANIEHKPSGKEKMRKFAAVPDHKVGMKLVLDALVDSEYGVLGSFSDIDAVGHRIVQGADFFSKSVLVDEDVMEKIAICCDFAPLHNPAHILGIRAMQAVLPEVPQVAVFDTAFHQTMEPKVYMYALPKEYYDKYRVRRYGAHGTSHHYVSHRGVEFADLDPNNSKVITCHIGNGSSVTAVKNGKCVDTSMGFTPLEGMIMGTRCGNIDASIVPYLMKKEGLSPDQATEMMNKKSGFLGLSRGKTSDCRDMCELREQGNEDAALVLDKLVLDITKLIGQYIAEMGGVDLIIFTAGIAENNAWLRRDVSKNFAFLGLDFDEDLNAGIRGVEAMLTKPESKIKVALIPTEEELMIARDTMNIAKGLK